MVRKKSGDEVMSEGCRFGIDLGTTNSAVARSNGIDVLVYQNNSDLMNVTPSAIRLHKSGRLIVGRKAYGAVADDPENVATEFKRNMGQKVSKTFPGCGRSMSPEELSAEVLKSMKDDVRKTGEEITQAVITVPAAFGTLQCEATSRAASLAGITKTYLLQEPIAASVAYGVEPGNWNKRLLVFDLGGGTLDVAVVSTREGRLTVLEHQGNNLLGGKDMDRIIVEQMILPALDREFELPEAGSPERLRLVRRLLTCAEQAKIDLSNDVNVTISIAGVGADRRGTPIEIEIDITRAEFEPRIEPLVQTCIGLARRALAGARLSGADLDRILLVGGPTQIPYVRAAVADGLGAMVDSSIDPMTVVARGAALFASSLEWADTTVPSARSNTAVTLQLGYDKVSSLVQAPVAGSVAPRNVVEAVKFDADGGFWTSGWIPLIDNTFDTQLQLLEGKQTRFWVYARQPDGTLLDVEPNSLSIRHGLVPTAPPLPHSIGIEVVKSGGKSELDFIFPKGRPLPAETRVRYRAAREFRPTQPDEILAIKVWEGETPEDPKANEWVGAMTISAHSLRRPIREGSEVELAVRIDESRRISVDAFLRHTGESFSGEIYLPEREQRDPNEQVRQLPSSIEHLLGRIEALETASVQSGNFEAAAKVARLRKELEDLDLDAAVPAGFSDDRDHASRLLQRTQELRRQLIAIEKEIGAGSSGRVELEKAREELDTTKEIIEKFGSARDKDHLSTVKRELETADRRADMRSARKAGEDLQSLKWRVLFSQEWFWKEAFEAQQSPGRKFLNPQEARKWLEAGQEALRKGDSPSLEEAVKNLWRLQPKPEADVDKERALESGLRRF
jgi:molecular chaperone DnaK